MENTVIEQLKKENAGAKLRLVEYPFEDQVFEFVIVGPSETTWKSVKHFKATGNDDQAIQVLVYDCLKYPAKVVAAEIFKEYPIVMDNLSNEIVKAAGGAVEAKVTKI